MAQAILRNIVIGLVATGLLAGCVEGTGGTGDPGVMGASPAKKAGGSRDIEAPELFQATETALWDGRPSLGGIWVASPDAKDPERVSIVNTENGKSVTGALFRRERDNPGPRIQLSSDAAEALGVLAGQPVTLTVTALRREEEAPAEVVEPEETPPEAAETEEVIAAESVDAPPADDAAKVDADAAATAAAAAAALDAVDTAPEGAAPAVEDPAKPKTWKERRAEAKAAREAKKAAAAAAKAEAEAAKAAAAGEAPEEGVSPDAVEITDIETAPLDAGGADAPADAPAAAPAAEAAPEPAVVEAPAAATGRTIQIATFSKEENATRAQEALAKIGVTARIKKSGTEGKMVWSLLATGDAAMLKSIKSAGFADAYFLN